MSDKTCGSCTLCCKLFSIDELDKPADVWCSHCIKGEGCTIYETRPQTCRDYTCLWLQAARGVGGNPPMPDWMKPNKSKVVLSVLPDGHDIVVHTDPGAPSAWRSPRVMAYLQAIATKGVARVIVKLNDARAYEITRTGPIALTVEKQGDGILVSRAMERTHT